jgi:hypothetical protein
MLDLANPSPGDMVSPGDYIVSGITFDPVTQSASGVSRIDFFLGSRDAGGEIVGSVVPSDAAMSANPRAFQVTLSLPEVQRADNLVAYAYSAGSAASTVLSTPIQIGSPPKQDVSSVAQSPTAVPQSVTTKNDCPTVGLVPGAGITVSVATTPVVAVTPAQGPSLHLGNPNANDIVPRGAYNVFGLAFDPASQSGSGVDRVDFFLDSRDEGGLFMGSAAPNTGGAQLGAFIARLTVPTNASGGHNFVAYAHSTVSNQESSVSVPIFVGIAPSPTAHP